MTFEQQELLTHDQALERNDKVAERTGKWYVFVAFFSGLVGTAVGYGTDSNGLGILAGIAAAGALNMLPVEDRIKASH